MDENSFGKCRGDRDRARDGDKKCENPRAIELCPATIPSDFL